MDNFSFIGYDGRLYCHLHIATHCNYRCSYCYPKLEVNQQPMWRPEEQRFIADKINSIERVKQIVISGLGEITLTPGFLDLIHGLVATRFSLVTNLSATNEYFMRMPLNTIFDCSFHPEHTTPEDFAEKVFALSEKYVVKPRIILTENNRKSVLRLLKLLPTSDRIQPRVLYDYSSKNTAGDLVPNEPVYERDGVPENKDLSVRNNNFHGMYCNVPNSTLIVSPDRTVTSCIHDKRRAASMYTFDFSKLNNVRAPMRCDKLKCSPCNLKDAKFKNITDCFQYAQEHFDRG